MEMVWELDCARRRSYTMGRNAGLMKGRTANDAGGSSLTTVALDEQHDVIAFLSTPQAYGPRADAVERIDTHISIVWLAGDRVYKLKRAVRFDYVDFSTIALRRAACEAEAPLESPDRALAVPARAGRDARGGRIACAGRPRYCRSTGWSKWRVLIRTRSSTVSRSAVGWTSRS